jgi:quinolinate synthase
MTYTHADTTMNSDGPQAPCGEIAARAVRLPRPSLEFTPEVERELASVYARLRHVTPFEEWKTHAPYIKAINDLKKERNAVLLAHNYMTPEIFFGVADHSGDSLALARQAVKSDADVIVQAGVHFMAETSKILNPEKTVLIPDLEAGCSLADSITASDVRALREKHPGVPIVTYINTSAEVKAECDITCTSANALKVVEAMAREFDSRQVLLIPDKFLARNVDNQTDIEVLTWEGRCEVHERFSGPQMRSFRNAEPEMKIIAHPECPPDVLEEADFSGSTAGMIEWVRENRPQKVMLVTECSMSDNVSVENPDVQFIRPCNLCPHMKRITLPAILDALLEMKHEVCVDPEIAARARKPIERMIALKD